jgi:ATP-binding protein involved in chromosome partitioning
VSLLTRGRFPVPDILSLQTALGAVQDPELHRPLAELDMLGAVEVDKRGRVRVVVRLTTVGCPLRERLRSDVESAVSGVGGVTSVDVIFDTMSEGERLHLAGRLRGGRLEGTHPFGPDSATRVYAVASGKGGVGKSSVTANLAVALARSGQRVGVLDADVWGWSVPQLFGIRRSPVALKGLMLPVEAHGVALMSVGFFVEEGEPVVWRGPMLHKAIEQFLGDVHWGDLDVLLIDLPPGTGDVTLSLLELVPNAALLAVTTPQVAAQTVAARVGRMARDARMPVAGVVENMSGLVCDSCGASTPLFGSGGGAALAESIGAPLLGQVPLDVALREAGDAGTPVIASSPHAPSARELSRIALTLPVTRSSIIGRMLPVSVV